MKKLIVMATAAALMASVSVSSFAAGKSLHERCEAQAEKHKIAEDKLDAYVKTCVEKHTRKMKHHKAAPAAAPMHVAAPMAPAAPAAPAEPGK
jgi:hypothetical protein